MKNRLMMWGRLALVVLGLSVAIGTGCSTTDTPSATPVASAGDNQSVLKGATVTLDGSASVGVSSIVWTFTSKPTGSAATLSNASSLTPTFVADVAGSYVAQLSINGGASTASVTVTVNTVLAKITAGSGINNRTVFNQSTYAVNLDQVGATLVGTGSQAGTGSTIASYTWTQASGPTASPTSGSVSPSYVFTAPGLLNLQAASQPNQYKWQVMPIGVDDTVMVFTLTVTDTEGNSDSTSATVYLQNANADMPVAAGTPNVPLGSVVTMSGPTYKKDTTTAITDWTWNLIAAPAGSAAYLSSTTSQFPQFTTDLQGLYQLTYSSTSGSVSGSINVNAGAYVGVGTIGGTTPLNPQCASCHNGTVQADVVTSWAATTHASLFSNNIALYATQAPTPSLWQTNTVGYGQNAASLGFDTLVSNEGFEFPSTGMTYSAFTSGYPTIAKLANVQCENCHGPGSGHSGSPSAIAFSYSKAGVCGQCHSQMPQWNNSIHAEAVVGDQTTWLGASCSRCHTTEGFVGFVNTGTQAAISGSDAFVGVGCVGCHDPHDATNTNQLRMMGNLTMIIDNTTVDAGKAAVCYKCHDGFYEYNQSGTSGCFTDTTGTNKTTCLTNDQAAISYLRQVHHNPQAPVLEGKGALTDLVNGDGTGANNFTLTENSFHSGSTFILSEVTGNTTLSSTNDKCITCHMPTGPGPSETGYQHMGGHSFAMTDGDTEHTAACTPCHTTLTEFNRTARADYDGDGTLEGIQTEVRGLLFALAAKIQARDTTRIKAITAATAADITKNSTLSYNGTCSNFTSTTLGCKAASGTTSCDNRGTGKARTDYQVCNFIDLSDYLKRAIWNYNMITQEGSFGIHNAAMDIQLLQKTYTAVGQISGTNTFAQDYPNATLR